MRIFKKKGLEKQLEEIAKKVEKQKEHPDWYISYQYHGEEIKIKSDHKIAEDECKNLMLLIVQQYYTAHRDVKEVGNNICYKFFKGKKTVCFSETPEGVEVVVLNKMIGI